MGGAGGRIGVPEGKATATIYGLIKEEKYMDAVALLDMELQNFPRSRAALSLLGFCYYSLQDFRAAALTYEQLVQFHPEVEEYRIYYSQSLFKAGFYPDATKVALSVEAEEHRGRLTLLQAAIKYEEDDLAGCESLLGESEEADADVLVGRACIRFKEGKIAAARELFEEAMSKLGWQASIAYNLALCHYKAGDFTPALNMVGDIIIKGVGDHPELSVGSNTGGLETRSVGNTQILRETALVEAFNLRAAIEFKLGNLSAADEALTDMPPRTDEEIDPVTLHNQALIRFEDKPQVGFRKLNFLLQNPPFPDETLRNLLLLYLRHEAYDLAADVLAENVHLTYGTLTYKHLTPELADFIEATITVQTSPAEAYRKFDTLTSRHIDSLRKYTKQIQDARFSKDSAAIKKSLEEYDAALERYIPVLMGMAKVYWDREHYDMVEKLFRQSGEFCSEHDVWTLNVAHVYFMKERYEDAIRCYEPVVAKSANPLDVTAIILANLCVSYIMMNQNDVAEALMKRIEKAERYHASQPEHKDKPIFHLCIVNLVIGTLYCAKANFGFGIGRIIKSFDPLERKLSIDTFFYAKRCLLGLAEAMSKQLVVLEDSIFEKVIRFLDSIAAAKPVVTRLEQADGKPVDTSVHNTVREARMLKMLFLRVRDQ